MQYIVGGFFSPFTVSVNVYFRLTHVFLSIHYYAIHCISIHASSWLYDRLFVVLGCLSFAITLYVFQGTISRAHTSSERQAIQLYIKYLDCHITITKYFVSY